MEHRKHLRLTMAILLVVVLACTVGLAITFLPNGAKATEAPQRSNPYATVHLGKNERGDSAQGIYYVERFTEGWQQVIKLAEDASEVNSYVKVILETDWVASDTKTSTGVLVKYFSNENDIINTTCFDNGRILVPSNTDIEIDLNGKSIDRGLTTVGVANGQVLYVRGDLTITDSVGGGKITGGYNLGASGGGIQVLGGTLNLVSCSVEGNRASAANAYGAGIYVTSGNNPGIVNLYNGASITNNHFVNATNSYGGGVCVYSNATFNMYGGVVENNSAIFGGGIAGYRINNVGINIEGGSIRNNEAYVETDKDCGGGAIYALASNSATLPAGQVKIVGGDITNNRSNKYGGAIYVATETGSRSEISLVISGGNIHHNVVAALDRSVYGGGIAIRRPNRTAATNSPVVANLTNATIERNYAIANCENDDTLNAYGAGVAILSGEFTLTSGEIRYNRTYSVTSGASQEDLNAVCQALMHDSMEGLGDKISNGKAVGGGVYCEMDSSFQNPTGSLVMAGGSIHDNRANNGGGLYVNGKWELKGGNVSDNYGLVGSAIVLTETSEVHLSGNPIVRNNYSLNGSSAQENSNLQITSEGYKLYVDGALADSAIIHISVADSLVSGGMHFTTGYAKTNGKFVAVDGKSLPNSDTNPTNGVWAAANPCQYFVIDATEEQHLLVYSNGELGVGTATVTFTVNYSDASSDSLVFGGTQNIPAWNYTEWSYGSSDKRPTSIASTGVDALEIPRAAGVYTLNVATGAGDAKTSYYVVVHTKELGEDDVVIELSDDKFIYDGKYHTPTSCSVKLATSLYEQEDLVLNIDYTISYENNRDAGLNTAVVVITFKGNFSGVAHAYFTIEPSEDSKIEIQVAWQVLENGEWTTFTAETAPQFTFNGNNQGNQLRALLTINEKPIKYQTVYAKGVVGDSLQHPNMYIEFSNDGNVEDFINAGEYTLTLIGYFNYKVQDEDRSIKVDMLQLDLDLSEDMFANYLDANNSRLWLLKVGDAQIITLLDEALYLDPDAPANQHGEKVTKGQQLGGFARFRDTAMSLILNPAYTLADGRTLSQLLEKAASVTYTPASGTTGQHGQVENVTTTVTITFDSNYTVGSSNVIKLEWKWKIVTISNSLRTVDGLEEFSMDLPGWLFADPDGYQSFYFRAEHGNAVIYTYYNDGELVGRFAVVYANNTLYAPRYYYEVKQENGSWVVDTEKRITNTDYLATYNYELRAGNYTMEVTVPALNPSNDEHTHWWNGETATDYGTRYYEYTYTFHFTVEKRNITFADYTDTGVIRVVFPEYNFVDYTGTQDNVVEPEIWVHGVLLQNGVDYTLSSASINIGRAVLTITGMGSLSGSFTIQDAYEIRKANNGWKDVPYIMQWTYNTYDSSVNLIKATPLLLDDPAGLWFAISTDEKGENMIAGLEHFTLDVTTKYVSDEVSKILAGLHQGNYYLIGHVEGTDNYYELQEQIIPFTIFQANNYWEITPTVNTWTEGAYITDDFLSTADRIVVNPAFGTAVVKVIDEKGIVYYDSEMGIDILASAKNGRYTLIASVKGTSDYTGLADYTLTFDVFKKPGLPWWATLLVAVGSLGLAALIIFILWKKGVFRVITDKILIAIRTRVSVEATIASVRAAKMMEDGRKSVEEAKRKERLEQLRQKAKAKREMSPEERAAELEAKAKAAEAKAQADAEVAERLRKRSEKARAKVEKAQNAPAPAEQPASEPTTATEAEQPTEAVATEAPETPSEE